MPNRGILLNVFRHHRDAWRRIQFDDIYAQRAEAFDAPLKICAVTDDERAESELPDKPAAVPAGSERRNHDQIAIAALAPRVAKRIRFAVYERIVVLHAGIVALADQFAALIENR